MKLRLRHFLVVATSVLGVIIGISASQVASGLQADGWNCPAGTNWDNVIGACR